MKKALLPLLIAALLLPAGVHSSAQIPFVGEDIEHPAFPARDIEVHGTISSSIEDYLSLHVQYPPEAIRRQLSGTEVIQFTVSPEGTLGSFKVMNSISPAVDREVIRVLETTSGNWVPGSVNGIPATMTKEISLVFKTNPRYDLVYHAKEYQYKGNVLMFMKKDPARALRFYNQAKRLLPFEESVLANCCLCRFELGDEEGAKKELNRLLSLYPVDQEMHFALSKGEYFAQLKQEMEQDFLSGL